MLASISTSTKKQYQGSLDKWSKYCVDSNTDPLHPSVSDVLRFLKISFDIGSSYGTLNTIRSAISLISSERIGSHSLITRFLKGCYNLKPSKPKYSATWDVNIVLDYLDDMPETKLLSLKDLTMKTVTLLALVSAQRAQTLSILDLHDVKYTNAGIEIIVTGRTKTSAPGLPCQVIKLPECKERPNLCIYRCLLYYMEVTQQIRGNNTRVFLSTKSPHNPVTTATLSRWIKNTLKVAGIDTNVFSDHSTRHASTSAALDRGVDLEIIKKAAGWSEKSRVFFDFYNRPIINNNNISFAEAILIKF